MSKVKFFIQQSWLLIVSSFFFGLLIAVTYAGLEPLIKAKEAEKINRLMGSLVTDANNFELAIEQAVVELSKTKTFKTDIYKALDDNGDIMGFIYIAEGPGFADKIKLVIAVDGKYEKFYGFKVLASNETPFIGDRIKEPYYNNQYEDAPVGVFTLVRAGDPEVKDNEIVAISGATVSSEAVVKIFNSFTEKIKEQLSIKGLINE